MKKSLLFRMALLVVALLPMALASCGDDEPNPDSGTTVKPTTEISDPEGTITLSMRNADSGKTYLDNQFYIENENFRGGYFVSLGQVKGLGNVSTIPFKGWSTQVAVVPGCGYVAYNPSNNTFYRIYVVQEIVSTSGGVMGAEVKYQKPFKGVDEALRLLTTVASIPGSGESVEVLFSNSSLIPFTAKASEDWCHVENCSSYDYHFLANGVSIWCDENMDTQPRSATVTLTTSYGKVATIAVTQSGPEPFVKVDTDNLQNIPAVGGTIDVNFGTNIDANSFSVSGTPEWLTAEVNVVNISSRVRYIGTRAVTKQTATQYGYIRLIAEPNTGAERTASLTIKSKDGKATDGFTITQNGSWISIQGNTANPEYEINAQGGTVTDVTLYSSLPFADLKKASDDWLSVSLISSSVRNYDLSYDLPGPFYELVVRISATENTSTSARKGVVKFVAGKYSVSITVNQKERKLELSRHFITHDKNSFSETVTVNGVANFEPKSSAPWCTFSINGNQLTVRAGATTENRKCEITFEGFDDVIVVKQSKYKVGDNFDEDGIIGTVRNIGYSSGCVGFVAQILSKCEWSTENVLVGANNEYDGLYNMAKVKEIPGWEDFYPAFAEVEETLNVNGITGWYLPSYYEARALSVGDIWTSTESDQSNAISTQFGRYSTSKKSKYNICAIHRFDF